MTDANMDLAIRYGAAWAAHNPDAILAMHTDDTVFHMHGGGDPAQGRPVREAIAAIFAQSPDLRFDRKTVYFGDGHIVTAPAMAADGCENHQAPPTARDEPRGPRSRASEPSRNSHLTKRG
jgi:hypothetical protein